MRIINRVSQPLPPMPVADLGTPVVSSLVVPVRQATVMVLNSAGVHLRDEQAFAPVNDLSSRRIRADTDPARLRPSHPAPMRRPGLRDINVMFPCQRLAELAAALADRDESAGMIEPGCSIPQRPTRRPA